MKKALLIAPMGSVHSRFNQANIRALQSLGYQVTLMANFDEDDAMQKGMSKFVSDCKEEGIEILSYPFARHSLFQSLRLLPKIKQILKMNNYDIVHAHTETGGLICRMAMSVAKKSKYVYTPHGMSFYKGSSLKSQLIYRPVEKWISKAMHANLAMNKEEFDVFEKWNSKTARFVNGVGLDRESIVINSNQSSDVEISSDNFLIISVGELNENKNHQTVIKALSHLKDRNFTYLICGVGELKDKLENLAQELGLKDKVVFAGYRNDVPTLLKKSDLFVFPSYHEGLPVSVMEAMTLGLPIICSKIRGNVDIVEHGKNGYLCNPKDEIAFSKYIQHLMDNKEERISLGEESIKRSNLFDIKYVQEQLKEIYKGLNIDE